MRARYIFLDLETTGLDPQIDEITECAFIVRDSVTYTADIEHQMFVAHTRLPNAWVLGSTDYLTRILPANKTQPAEMLHLLQSRIKKSADVRTYLVGAAPAFDSAFLDGYAGLYNIPLPYDYALIDVKAMAMGALGLAVPPKLNEIRGLLGIAGANEAAHTAMSDAREARLVFDALQRTTVVGTFSSTTTHYGPAEWSGQ